MNDSLNREVTEAIMNADRLLSKTISAWAKVLEIETILSRDGSLNDAERGIASRGMGMARIRLRVLEALERA